MSNVRRQETAVRRGFPGFIRINDLPFADRVDIFTFGSSLFFSPGDRAFESARKIRLYPMPATALITNPERMRSGFFYSTHGTEVGSCSQGGSSRESVMADSWPVIEFAVGVKYGQETLTIGVSGTTGEGVSGSDLPRPLEPWKFRIEVRIPRNVIADALNLPDAERRMLQQSWDALDADA